MAISDGMITTNLASAKENVLQVCAYGKVITLVKPGTTDEFGELLTESSLPLHSFPVRFSPFDRETTLKITWAEAVSVIFYVAAKEVDNLSLTIDDLKSYINVYHEDKEYEIAYIEPYSNFADSFLYVIIGAKL